MSEIAEIFTMVSQDFPREGLRVLLVGGHAVNVHGVSHATVDIDFIMDAEQEPKLRDFLKTRGYTNLSAHGSVLFCNRPDSPMRIDFLRTDQETMLTPWNNRYTVPGQEGHPLHAVSLCDLVAMKITALRSNFARRMHKDLPDVLRLTSLHNWSFQRDMIPLLDRFGSPELKNEIQRKWEGLP